MRYVSLSFYYFGHFVSPFITVPSLPTLTISLGVQRVTTKLVWILGRSRPARTRMKWRWQFLLGKPILTLPTKMLCMFSRPRRQRLYQNRTLRSNKRTTTKISELMSCLPGLYPMYVPQKCHNWIRLTLCLSGTPRSGNLVSSRFVPKKRRQLTFLTLHRTEAAVTVNGYMAFFFYSVAGLACKSWRFVLEYSSLDRAIACSYPITRLRRLYADSFVCW